ncbi:MAG TPA: nitrilase-related carbon-nitrogen hydrolase [Planctomycetota bacterium]|nr:nitrilase-related carbon-nitrogen hydrolase [Planctomycetota bacterium]
MRDDQPPARFLSACVQCDIRRGDVAGNLRSVEAHLRTAHAAGALLAVLPEMWTTSFAPAYPPELLEQARAAADRVLRLSGEFGMVIVGSTVAEHDGRLFNVAHVCDRGRLAAEYRKIHLFSPNAEHKTLTAGSEPVVVDTSAGRLAVAICYDLRFPELVRWFFHERAEVLVVPAQWPEARATHWRALVDARAVENQLFVIGCNRTGSEPSLRGTDQLVFPGNSRVVDPMGDLLATGAGEDGVVLAEIELRKATAMRRTMPIAKDRRPEIYRSLWERAWTQPVRGD